MFTGVSPGKHGIYQFWKLKSPNYCHEIVGSVDWTYEPVWQTLAARGISCGVANVPMSHPPASLRGGWMVSWPLSPSLHFTSPDGLLRELREAGHATNTDYMMMWAGSEAYPARALAEIETRVRATRFLLERHPVDALFLVLTEFDRIAHYHWTPDGPGEAAIEALKRIDHALAPLIAEIPDECAVILASDHGFGPCHGDIHINALLREAGLLHQLSNVHAGSGEEAFIRGNDHAIGWSWSRDASGSLVDWERTAAYMPAPGSYGINLNLRGRQDQGFVLAKDRAGVERELADAVSSVRTPAGETIFELVPAAEVYSGPQLSRAPDFVLLPCDWGWMASCELSKGLFGVPKQQGVHRCDGFVLVRAHQARTPVGENAEIAAVGSTILALLDVESAFETECSPLAGITPAGPPRESRFRDCGSAPRNQAYQAEAERHLSALGYL
jgi:predicted AlkP superfamily phosphohydrolase/phosphomutase